MTAPLYTTAEAAALLGVSQRRVRVLAGHRRLGQRFGRAILFTAADLAAMRDRRVGRPRKTTAGGG